MFYFSFYKIGIELAPLIMDKVTGKPKRDPSTGYMMNHSLGTTDVTQLAINQGWPDPTQFRSRNLYKVIIVNISVLNPGMMLRVNSFTGNSWQVEKLLFFCLDLAHFQIKVKLLRRITLVSWVERWMTNSKDNTSSLGSPTGEGNKVFLEHTSFMSTNVKPRC